MAASEVISYLRMNIDDFQAKLGTAKAEMDGLEKTGSSNFTKLASVGKFALLGIGAAAVGVGIASVDLADKYQAATNTIAANGDISIAKADQIGKAFLGTAGTTIYSAQQIAGAFGQVAGQVKLMNGGVLNAKAAMDVMRPAMDLAEASGTNLNSATSDITNTLQAFGLKITQSPLVSNVLFNAARETGTSVDTLAGQIDKARARMGAAAPPVQQMGGLLVDLAQHGETGRAAMSTLSSAFTGILAPTAAVTKAQQAMGVSFTNAKGQLLPMDQIIGEVTPKIAGMGNAQATATLKSLGFGSAAQKMLGVIQAGPQAFDKSTAAVQRQNSAHDAAEKQAKTLQHQVEQVKATVEDYGVKIGQALIPKLQTLLEIGLKVSAWLGKHKEVLIAVAVVIGGVLVAAIGAFVVGLFTAEGALAVLIGPIGLVIAAVALLAAGVYEVIKHWGAISGFFKKIWEDVKRAFDDAWGFIKTLLLNLTPEGLIYEHWRGIVTFFETLWNAVKSGVIAGWNAIVAIFVTIPLKVTSALASFGSDLLHWFTEAWGKFTGFVKTSWDNEVAFWTTLPGKILNAVSSFLGLIMNWINTVWNTFKTWIETAWNNEVAFWSAIPGKIISAVSALGSMLWNWIVTAWNLLNSAILSAWNATASWFGGLPGRILGAIGDLGSVLYNAGKAVIEGLWNGLKDAWNAVSSWLGGIASKITSLKGPIEYDATILVPHGNAIMQGLANGLQQGFAGKVAPYLQGVAGQIAGQSFGTTGSFNAGISPVSGSTAAQAGGSNQPIYLQVNGQTFATLMLPSFQTAVLQAQRGSSVPIFGTTQ